MPINDGFLGHLGSSLEALNVRIARLAISLDVQLDDANSLLRFINQPTHPSGDHPTTSLHKSVTAEHRTIHKREELRGLLVLRYALQIRCVHEHGLALTHQLMVQTEEYLVRQGFKPGAGGMGLGD